jgi:hypothetical protein
MHCSVPLRQLAGVADTRRTDAGFLVQYLQMVLALRAPPRGAGGPSTWRRLALAESFLRLAKRQKRFGV